MCILSLLVYLPECFTKTWMQRIPHTCATFIVWMRHLQKMPVQVQQFITSLSQLVTHLPAPSSHLPATTKVLLQPTITRPDDKCAIDPVQCWGFLLQCQSLLKRDYLNMLRPWASSCSCIMLFQRVMLQGGRNSLSSFCMFARANSVPMSGWKWLELSCTAVFTPDHKCDVCTEMGCQYDEPSLDPLINLTLYLDNLLQDRKPRKLSPLWKGWPSYRSVQWMNQLQLTECNQRG